MAEEIFTVNASGLRLRQSPVNGATISILPTDHTVEKIGKSDEPGWWHVSTRVAGMMETGYVASEWLAPVDPKPKFNVPFMQNLKATYERVKQFVGELAEMYTPEQLPDFNAVLTEYEINKNSNRLTHFLAQLAHESARFTTLIENLNYSASALRRVFSKYFPDDAEAEEFARQPERIANRVYANRMGNGDEASGDGWRYRGRGFIQLTGKNNYRQIGEKIGRDLVNNPDIVAEDPQVALQVAAAYWDANNINKLADRDDIRAVTRAINGGFNGLDDRKAHLARARSIWG